MIKSPIIVAMDMNTREEVDAFVAKAGKSVQFLKVGMYLFTKYGPSLVKDLKNKGYKIFLDLKFHDIPNTVEHACRAAVNLGIDMLTIHSSGGREMIKAAANGINEEALKLSVPAPVLLSVTVLTSMDDTSLKDVGYSDNTSTTAMRLATLSIDSGATGIVCSPHEVGKFKKEIKKAFVAVTPGIRFDQGSESKKDDQKRIATPEFAISEGADFLVVGRPIYAAPDPVKAVAQIHERLGIK